ncbi:MAG: MiaB/RimO family radical SAM methylthiotransferase, partial [Coriobacteriia bacterium]|nr:MiaB/RimO family radical SAM methylthiotransferase [Coriobacteriia bacterium]
SSDMTKGTVPFVMRPVPFVMRHPELDPGPTPAVAEGQQLSSTRPSPLRTTTAPWAYVKIADGCDRFCSYCTIPLIKGRYRSVPAEEILTEVAGLVDGGVREIVLIAQDTGIWGLDLKLEETAPVSDLPGLLQALATAHPGIWFRVMYLQPEGITDPLLNVMAAYDNICNYLDIPLQHASARVLEQMNRSGSGAEYLELLSRIRAALPDVCLRTTVIAGFPGETRAEAAELERFLREAAFDFVGVFAYSQEEGTVAGARADQVPLRTRKARAQRLRDVADAVGFEKSAQRIGATEEVLIVELEEDAPEDPFPLIGRTKRQAPDVDGVIHVDRGRLGQRVSATIVHAYCYEHDGKVTAILDEC